jgi:hypothetical protein
VGGGLCDIGLSKIGVEVEVEPPAADVGMNDEAFGLEGPGIAGPAPDCLEGEFPGCCCCSSFGEVTLW